ncbi:hypothetical protein JW960_27635 [candidate division KSB1 bacterium]|nr:hypothetical protein [candidate division KSB1 bacterium]
MKRLFCLFVMIIVFSFVDINITIPKVQSQFTFSSVSATCAQSKRSYKKPRQTKKSTIDTSVPIPGSLIVLSSLIGGGGIFIMLRNRLSRRKK